MAILVIGFAVGLAAGISSQQGAVKAAQQQAQADVKAASAREEAMQADYQTKLVEVASAKATVASQQAQLDQRQKDLDARTAALNATSFGDGVWVVGTDIQPGTYRAAQAGSSCYWAKLKADEGIMANDLPQGPTTVTIDGSVNKFKSSNCGTWTKVG